MKFGMEAFLTALLIAAGMPGCAAGPAPLTRDSGEDADRLEGVEWHLVSYGPAAAPVPLLAGTASTLLLDGSSAQASGLAGCNRFTGSYAVSGERITLGRLAMTKRLCADPAGLMDQERNVAGALTAAATYRFEQGELLITYAPDGLLRYSRNAPANSSEPSLAELRRHVGQYPRDILLFGDPLLIGRIHTLLGDKHDVFLENMRVQGPISEENGVLFVTGNKPHQGGTDMAALLVDPAANKVQIWLASGGVEQTFSEAEPPLADPPSVATFKSNFVKKP